MRTMSGAWASARKATWRWRCGLENTKKSHGGVHPPPIPLSGSSEPSAQVIALEASMHRATRLHAHAASLLNPFFAATSFILIIRHDSQAIARV